MACVFTREGLAFAAQATRLRGVQAGAAKVYAMEASNMADFARMLAAANPGGPGLGLALGLGLELGLGCCTTIVGIKAASVEPCTCTLLRELIRC